jgi:hypothetical protein
MASGIPENGSLGRNEAEALVADSLRRFGWDFEPEITQFLVELAMLSRAELGLVATLLKGAAAAAPEPAEPEAPPHGDRKPRLGGLKRPPRPGSPRRR